MASANAGKIREIAKLLDGLGIEVVAQSDFGVSDAEETGSTFAENSLLKARHAAAVYSARYAGSHGDDEANNDKHLEELAGVDKRGAAFRCVATFVDYDGEALVADGEWRGEILHERRGAGGFGYDPLFLVPDCNCSSAELTQEQKNARSHRGQALRKLVERIEIKYA